jgi:hypothetical protein
MLKTEILSNSNYKDLLVKYENNKNKEWSDWLLFDKIFEKPGKQGVVGLLVLKDDTKKKYVFKMSQFINYLVEHENIIMSGLKDISDFCPHFCKGFGIINCNTEPKYKKNMGNPFEIISKYPIQNKAILYEYIEDSYKFYNYIRSSKIDEDILYSTVKQVLMGLSIAQKEKNFTHYDLHSCNIMMKNCEEDVVFLYVLDEENQFCVPTYGHYPVIIDFGFSYIKDMEDSPLWTSLAHTQVGFISDRFDYVADPKLFLVTVSGEIEEKRKTKKSKKFRRIIKNVFNPLKIDWDSGWDDIKDKGAADYVTDVLEGYNERSKIFDQYSHYCIDMIQSLIILPLENQNYKNIDKAYTSFLKEWVKIEKEIGNSYYNLYILKGVIDTARKVRPDYISKQFKDRAVKEFRNDVYERINKVSKFCKPKSVNFEIMLCALLILARCTEGILYDIIESRIVDKNKEYDKLPLKSTEQIYAGIEVNIPDKYIYNKNTKVIIFDCVKKDSKIFIPEKVDIDNINDCHPLTKGTFIYDLYLKQKV